MSYLKTKSDAVVAFAFLKRLLESVVNSDAYKMKLVDSSGNIIKTPETEKEKSALTVLDQIVFKLRRMLGTKISDFNKLLYLLQVSDNYINNLSLKDSKSDRSEISRLRKDIAKMNENEYVRIIELLESYKAPKIDFKDIHRSKTVDFNKVNKAYFRELLENKTLSDKYIKMTETELVSSGFYEKYPHLR